jgi:phage tail tape-measure protein
MDDNMKTDSEKVGGLAGLGAGVIAGAQVGTVLIPIPVVGTFLGAMLGGVFGSAVGQRVGGAALDGVNAFMDGLSTSAKRDDDDGPDAPAGGVRS